MKKEIMYLSINGDYFKIVGDAVMKVTENGEIDFMQLSTFDKVYNHGAKSDFRQDIVTDRYFAEAYAAAVKQHVLFLTK